MHTGKGVASAILETASVTSEPWVMKKWYLDKYRHRQWDWNELNLRRLLLVIRENEPCTIQFLEQLAGRGKSYPTAQRRVRRLIHRLRHGSLVEVDEQSGVVGGSAGAQAVIDELDLSLAERPGRPGCPGETPARQARRPCLDSRRRIPECARASNLSLPGTRL